jgi:hypothetical protein
MLQTQTSRNNAGPGSNSFTTLPTPWQCLWIPYASRPPRLPLRGNVAHDIECLATDGLTCLWAVSNATCNRRLVQNVNAANPLACGTDHLQKFGTTGYDTPGHWCFVGNWSLPDNNQPSPGNNCMVFMRALNNNVFVFAKCIDRPSLATQETWLLHSAIWSSCEADH